MVDSEFDNEDSPYFYFSVLMHKNLDDVYEEIEMPVVKCENEFIPDF